MILPFIEQIIQMIGCPKDGVIEFLIFFCLTYIEPHTWAIQTGYDTFFGKFIWVLSRKIGHFSSSPGKETEELNASGSQELGYSLMLQAERDRLYFPVSIDNVPSLYPNKRVAVENGALWRAAICVMEHAVDG